MKPIIFKNKQGTGNTAIFASELISIEEIVWGDGAFEIDIVFSDADERRQTVLSANTLKEALDIVDAHKRRHLLTRKFSISAEQIDAIFSGIVQQAAGTTLLEELQEVASQIENYKELFAAAASDLEVTLVRYGKLFDFNVKTTFESEQLVDILSAFGIQVPNY